MKPAVRFTGDRWAVPIRITKGGIYEVISSGATVRGILTTHAQKPSVYPGATEITLSEAETGSDWSAGLVVFVMSTGETTALTQYEQARILIKVNDVSFLSTQCIDVKQGLIV